MHDAAGTMISGVADPARSGPLRALVPRAAVIARALLLAVSCAAAGCADRTPRLDGRAADLEARLADEWDAEFVLERTPMGTPSADRRPVRGTLALLEAPGHGRVGALPTPVTHVGVYHVDFRPFGFSPPSDGSVPGLVASVILPDTITAVIPADAHDGELVLRGVLVADSVSGAWSYGYRAAGGWGGRFVLRRRHS